MKLKKYLILVLAALFLHWCGDTSSTDEDGDTTTDPTQEDITGDTTVEDIPTEIPVDGPTDMPADEAGEVPHDVPVDGPDCPDPPECEDPLVLGMVNAMDENGCVVGYCCTGIEVRFDNVIVTEGTELKATVHAYTAVENIGETSVISAYLECSIMDPDGATLLGECEQFTLTSGDGPIDVGEIVNMSVDTECDWTTGTCGESALLVCTFYWETIGCYSDGEGTATAETFVVCPP